MLFNRGRRASRACVWCHQRKVRCDASFRGCPCTRCIQDGQEKCVLREKLPRLLLRNLQLLDKEDISYLVSKGCLMVPAQPALDDFVKQYFLHVHPGTPVLDEASFWHMYLECDNGLLGRGLKMSVFVFQAMLFTSCTYVSEASIQQCGFKDKRVARNAFYNRAKLLLDLKAEDQPLSKAQGAILLSHHVSPDDPQIGSLWLANATQNAVMLGKQPTPQSDQVEDCVKKRLWWSILLRDRILCLGLRRRTQVTSKHFNAEANYFDESDFADEINYSNVYNRSSKRILIEVLQQQCRLAVLVTDMVSFMFTSYGASSPSLPFKKFQAYQNGISNTKKELLKWEKNFLLLKSDTAADKIPQQATTMIKMTYLYYYTAQLHIAHYEALLLESHTKFAGQTYADQLCECRDYLQNSVQGLNQTMKHFSERQNIEFIPLCLLAFVAMPLIVSALDVKLARTPDETRIRTQRLDLLAEIYRRSATLYDVTNFVAVGSNQILQLVYRISQELLVREDRQLIEDAVGTDLISLGPSKSRLSGWLDLFLYYPRLYLLVSTSVDYSLSVGRLPHDGALPELLRPTQGDSLKIELPWVSSGELKSAADMLGETTFWCPSSDRLPVSIVMPQDSEMDIVESNEETQENQGGPTVPTSFPDIPQSAFEGSYGYDDSPTYLNQDDLNLDLNIPRCQPTTGPGPSIPVPDAPELSPDKTADYTGDFESFAFNDFKHTLDLRLLDYISQATFNPTYMDSFPHEIYGNGQIDCNGKM
ncbi:hypothetical protein BDV59DRAFT_211269 [Aspergillus ambiguus]|uniref:Zn(II)2Cys6 transcription factor n=1 Tax=Aspergillus ambiguus TaxID=176160 RepID=UPI003CCDE3EC